MLNSQGVYGATVPDLFNLMRDLPDYEDVAHPTHNHFGQIRIKARRMGLDTFAFGFVSHNERWGADHTAHKKGRTMRGGYVIEKNKLLAPKLTPGLEAILNDAGVSYASVLAGMLSSELAEPLIETAIDLLIKRNEDPAIGEELSQSSRDRPSSVPDLLEAAYAREFARHMQVAEEEAGQMIRETEAGYQKAMILYGEMLAREETEAIREFAAQGAALVNSLLQSTSWGEVSIPADLLEEFIGLAISEVEGDYQEEVARTLSFLRHRSPLSLWLHRILKRN